MLTLLIANRGEIALRVMMTARALGIEPVAIYTDEDADAPHVAGSGRAIRVPSYLDIDAIVTAARESGADAVHPGYGFLSERAEFARAVVAAGLTFVGPTPEAIEQMGRKDAAREIAIAAGVPVIPAYDATSDPATLDYPVLVKAAAGGGGKGMRIVRSAPELPEAMAAAAREADKAFGDATLLIEKYVEHGRHIEVQVFGDTHGNVLHLFERDCSVQRRHQKVIEEAPAPTITEEQRQVVHAAAVALARQVGYVNAGTVEFLLDTETGQPYLLEMNTRLQVEHPVTELITGQDLVEWQLRVAQGEPLPLRQDELWITGHAIEARIYAEDPWSGFLPQAGTTSLVRWPVGASSAPQGSAVVRVDHALDSGQVVSTSYDPMLGKVIAHGPDREAARQGLLRALDETAILGITTNTGFLRALLATEDFGTAAIGTAWLDHYDPPVPESDVPRVMVAWTSAMLAANNLGHPFQSDGFRLGASPAATIVALDRDVVVDRHGGTVDGVPVRQVSAEDHVLELVIDGRVERAVVNVQPEVAEVSDRGQRFVFPRPDAFADHGPEVGDGTIVAPMPGAVLSVTVAVGDRVAADQVLGTMEAMKMELALTAPFAGTVLEVGAVPGDRVALGARLFGIEEDPE